MKRLFIFIMALVGIATSDIKAQDQTLVKVNGLTFYIPDGTNEAALVCEDPINHPGVIGNAYKGHVVIPASITDNGKTYPVTTIIGAFNNDTLLTSVVIPNSVKIIYSGAFLNTGLTSVDIPASVSNIETYAFSGSKNLTAINVNAANPRYSDIDGALVNKTKDTLSCVPSGKSGRYIIPDGIKDCLWATFNGCSKITSVHFPTSFNPKDKYGYSYRFQDILSGTDNLTEITADKNNPYFTVVDGTSVTSVSKDTLLYIPKGIKGKYSIPEGITFCDDNIFYAKNITSLHIPSTYTNQDILWKIQNAWSEIMPLSDLNYIEVASNNPVYASIDGVMTNKGKDSLLFVPRARGGEYNIPTGIKCIYQNALTRCKKLTAVTIPTSVTDIDNYSFDLMDLTSLTLPASVKRIGDYAFRETKLTSLTIPSSVNNLGEGITEKCYSLKAINVEAGNKSYCSQDGMVYTITKKTLCQAPGGIEDAVIPEGTDSISFRAFQYHDSLKTIKLPQSLSYIGDYTFYNCPKLKEIILPGKLAKIGYAAFSGCTGLTSLDVPEKTELGGSFVYGCTLNPLIIRYNKEEYHWFDWYSILSNIGNSSVVYIHDNYYQSLANYANNYSGTNKFDVMSLDKPYGVTNITKYLKGFSYKIQENEVVNMEKNFVKTTVEGKEAKKLADGRYFVDGLDIDKQYKIAAHYNIKNEKDSIIFDTKTKSFGLRFYKERKTQCTIHADSVAFYNQSDTTAIPQSYSLSFENKEYAYEKGKPLDFEGLTPEKSYHINGIIKYQDGKTGTYQYYFSTKGLESKLVSSTSSPTTFRVNVTYKETDAVVDSIILKYGQYSWNLNKAIRASVKDPVFTGLAPDSTYTGRLYLKTTNGSEVEVNGTYNIQITTPALELTTSQPKIPVEKTAIVEAKTNTSNDEGHIGFEWRKYDAPASLASKEAYGVVIDGTAMGEIKGLSANDYYKVRAFFDCINGRRYYATNDWVTFDPSDVSYMDATVHTNADVTVTPSVVVLVGMIIQGSDDIIEQGFEYWENLTASTAKPRVMKVAGEVNTVVAVGQRMTAELTDLIDGTTYTYRAYAKTSKGTFYGEEQQFTTLGERPTGIEPITAQEKKLQVKAHSSNSTLYVNVSGAAANSTVAVNAMNGQLLHRANTDIDGTATIEMAGKAQGIVLISVTGADGSRRCIKTAIKN